MQSYSEFGPKVQELISFKEFSIFSSDEHFVRQSKTVWAILVRGISKEI